MEQRLLLSADLPSPIAVVGTTAKVGDVSSTAGGYNVDVLQVLNNARTLIGQAAMLELRLQQFVAGEMAAFQAWYGQYSHSLPASDRALPSTTSTNTSPTLLPADIAAKPSIATGTPSGDANGTIPSIPSLNTTSIASPTLLAAPRAEDPPSDRVPFVIYNTGVDDSGTPLADGAVDPHYQITAAPSLDAPGNAYTVDQSSFPFNGYSPWVPDGDGKSKWIAPVANEANDPSGKYIYQTTFNLQGFDSSTATISGQYLSDDWLDEIDLNGKPVYTFTHTPSDPGQYKGWQSLTQIAGNFVPGVNTLDFVVENRVQSANNPSGFRVELSGTVEPPSSGIKAGPVTTSCNCGCTNQAGSTIKTSTSKIGTEVPISNNAPVRYYDDNKRVTLETTQGGDSQSGGGLSTTTYSYTASTNASGVNRWAMKTVVGNPDGSTDTVYTDSSALVMLTDHYDPIGGQHTIAFHSYNAQGQLVLDAAPSAVNGYDDSYADLMNFVNGSSQYLNNTSGLITRYNFYTTTTATETTAGGVAGYAEDEEIQQGQQGTLIPQETWQYYAHAANGQIIAPIATDTVYRNDDGTGAETTSYTYTWFTNSAQMRSQTMSAPIVAAAQNGPGTADVTTTIFDQNGNPIWMKDPDGYIQYYACDPTTRAQIEHIVDVNTANTSEFSNLPTGWTTPTGGGLNLVTTDQVDSQGRTTEEISPNGNITYYVYLDAKNEERIYQGWNTSTDTPTMPTEVIRADAANGYTETLTMTAKPNLNADGTPNGTEAISDLQSLTRDYTNDAGQVVSEDSYFNLDGLAYAVGVMGTLGVSYYQTQYDYDNRGRLVRTQTANGTIYRTEYNSLDEEVSDWVGTNDTPTSGEWSPSNNNGTSNMVQVRSYQYDNGGVGDGDLTQEIDYPGLGATPRETDNYYDWRDRLVVTKSGVESSENDGVGRPIVVTTYDNLNEAIETQQYDGDGVTPQIVNGVLQALDPSLLRAQEIDSYDDQGRAYQTQVFDVNPAAGEEVSATALTTNFYLAQAVAAVPADPLGLVGVIDETSCSKWGDQTPGVQRQYLGCLGKIDNGIVAVHVGVAKGNFHALLDADLYLPEAWDGDRQRCRDVGIPDEVRYRPKWRIAPDQLIRLSGQGILFDWLVFDEGYGAAVPLLRALNLVGQRFVAEVPVNFAVADKPDGPTRRADRRLSMAEAKKGKRYRLAHQTVADSVWRASARRVWVAGRLHLLIVAINEVTVEAKYFLSNATEVPLTRLLAVAFRRWTVEHSFRVGKQEAGLMHYEGRAYIGLMRHLILALLVLGFVATQTERLRGGKIPR